ncbi:MAG: hypothetical protein CMQ15_13835 [Gammaproteobacteria bacterium]|mgnify:CR=1 FL=1|nr:hypothetical protein [Gammaproteobacteria bacterium]|tara:strand:+ start:2060 stop:2365 length:306 start_codon:yes stop_codon:yes gene_type:complete
MECPRCGRQNDKETECFYCGRILNSPIEDLDGSSTEMAIVVGSVEEEYVWMRNYCQGFEGGDQALQEIDGKAYDVHTLCNNKGKKRTVYFDISGFFPQDSL